MILLVIAAFTLTATTDSTPMQVNATSQSYAVTIVDYAFQPLHINITTGTKVTWTYVSGGATIHTVTSDPGTNTTQNGTPLLNSGSLNPSQSFSYTFDQPGYYPYQCALHPTLMNGWIVVTGNPVMPAPTQNGSDWILPVVVATLATAAILATWIVIRRKPKTSVGKMHNLSILECIRRKKP